MSPFLRNISVRWHEEVPGARWFKADLHIHTLDDHPSSNLKRPSGIDGPATDPDVQTAYARAFLRAAIANGIEVLGLTPHAVKAGQSDETSATWRIIEVWNHENDDDGIPFRDKIYAIFPGFEPSLGDGADGLHLIFLFDPEIDRENYLAAFNTIMGGLQPYAGNSLRMSTLRAKEAFATIEELHRRDKNDWNYFCLAAHAFGGKGLFSLRAQVLEVFPHQYIRGLQLKDEWLLADAFDDKHWLKKSVAGCHQALFHSSDAYKVEEIGRRHSLVKLASPRIESLRQAFLASNSRLRIAYCKDVDGKIVPEANLPTPLALGRPWLKTITLRGGTSLFAGQDSTTREPREQTFHLNPDLNCIIGGRMAGKSTLLDGLRVWSGHELPKDKHVRTDVESRAKNMFLSGKPEVTSHIHGPGNPTLSVAERWPAQFYTQRELQTAVHDQETRRNILYHLMPDETPGLIARIAQLSEIDQQLNQQVNIVETCRIALSDAEEEFQQVEKARLALEKFREAGIDGVINAQADLSKIELLEEELSGVAEELPTISSSVELLGTEELVNSDIQDILDGSESGVGLSPLVKRYRATLRYQKRIIKKMQVNVAQSARAATAFVETARANVQQALIASGGSAEDINQFDSLVESSGGYEKVQLRLQAAKEKHDRERGNLVGQIKARASLIKVQRETMDRVLVFVSEKYPDQIRVVKRENGDYRSLESWISGLKEGGVTRWWNIQKEVGEHGIDPIEILKCSNDDKLSEIGMTAQVSTTFSDLMTPKRKLELVSIRCEDKYKIELKVGDEFKEIDHLSGGAQVSVLLSLILATDDTSPLVIDQPEDEIDKGYLFDVLLPALHRLKGRRQIIFATHDANIVVNGDADQVIHLESNATFSQISNQGAIEKDCVKDAIVKILDGGRDAFELRQVKYGF